MGVDTGYSKAASRRIAVWEAMNQQKLAQAAADVAKEQFDVADSAKGTEPAAAAPQTSTATSPNTANQMSTAMFDKLLAMVSDLSDRFSKQESGLELASGYLKDGQKVAEGLSKGLTSLVDQIDKGLGATSDSAKESNKISEDLSKDVASLTGKIDTIAQSLTSLSARVDELAKTNAPASPDSTHSDPSQAPDSSQPSTPVTPGTTETTTVPTAATPALVAQDVMLDARFSALTA
jgi:hypothetical protein